MNIGIILYGQQFHTLLNQLYNGPVLLYQKLLNRLKVQNISYFISEMLYSHPLYIWLSLLCASNNLFGFQHGNTNADNESYRNEQRSPHP